MTATTEPKPPAIALAHDWLVGYRGGEAVLDAIAQAAAGVGEVRAIYTMFDDERPLTPTIDALPHVVWPIGRTRAGLRFRRWLLPVYPIATWQLSRRLAREHARATGRVDLLVSTSSAAIHGLRALVSPGISRAVPHICYCHSPPRYLWHQRDDYAGGVRGAALRLLTPWLRAADRRAAQGPPQRPGGVTRWIANSTHTRDRLRDAYGVDAAVIHPPVRTEFFTPREQRESLQSAPGTSPERPKQHSPYLLYAGALEPYKRVDLAIEAGVRLGTRLVIAGTGSDERRLKRVAGRSEGNNASPEFVGRVSDDRLRELYREAEALLYPQCEDFGIGAVEAQACGTPVVAYAKGGALDSVVDGMTGVLFKQQNAESLAAAICTVRELRKRMGDRAIAEACRENAERFGEERFAAEIRAKIAAAISSS